MPDEKDICAICGEDFTDKPGLCIAEVNGKSFPFCDTHSMQDLEMHTDYLEQTGN